MNRHKDNLIINFISRYWVYLLLVIAVIPLLILRDYTTSNELRYVSIASDALRDGNIFIFTNQGGFYADKPPLYLWIMMLAYSIAGVNCMWFASLFSLIPAIIVTELLISSCGKKLDPKYYDATRILICTCVLFLSMTFTLRMDMLLTMWIALTVRAFLRIYHGEGNLRKNQWLVGLYMFLGLFTKGPMGIIIPLGAIVVFLLWESKIKELGRYIGWRCWIPIVILSLSWWVCAYIEGGWEYINNLLFHQTVDRAVNAYHHKRPFWYYMVNIWWCMAPWIFLVLGAFIARICHQIKHKQPISAEEKICDSLAAFTFVILTCLSGKLPVYLLPALPYAVMGAILSTNNWNHKWQKALTGFPAALLAIASCGIIVLAIKPGLIGFNASPLSSALLIAGAILMILGASLTFIQLRNINYNALLAAIPTGAGMLLLLMCAGFALPEFNYLLGLRDVSDAGVEIQKEQPTEKIITYKLRRSENIDVYFQRPVESVLSEDTLRNRLTSSETIMVILPNKKTPQWLDFESTKKIKSINDKDIYIYTPIIQNSDNE